MYLRVRVRATVFQYHDFVVRIRGVACGRQNDTARRDSGQDDRLDAQRAQNGVQVGIEEGVDAPLRHDDVPRLRRDIRVNLRLLRTLLQPVLLFVEHLKPVPGMRFRVAGSILHDHINDRYPRLPRPVYRVA